jgi:hypothetical protein
MTAQAATALLAAGAFAITTASTAIGALVAQPPQGWRALPWPLRARAMQPARVALVLNIFAVALLLPPVGMVFFGLLGFRPPFLWMAAAQLIGLCGPIAVAMLMAWRIAPRQPALSYWITGCLSALFFSFPNTMVYVGMAIALALMPPTLANVAVMLLIAACAMAFAAWGGGIWVARALGLARPALPRATHAANWAGERVGVPASAVFELRWPRVTVDAFVFSRYLVLTDAAADLLGDEELLALCVRELTFFQQPWLAGGLRAMDSALVFFLLGCTAVGFVLGGNAMLVGTLTGYGGVYVMRPFARRVQLKADALAARSAIDPAAALRAMERQYELNLKPVVASFNSGREPHLYDRMVAAGISPAYPRPEPPSKLKVILSLAACVGTCIALSIAFIVFMAVLTRM